MLLDDPILRQAYSLAHLHFHTLAGFDYNLMLLQRFLHWMWIIENLLDLLN
jgi:hypothetical protein